METVWAISSPREFHLEAVARLVLEPKTIFFFLRAFLKKEDGHHC
jgi:hypothetical protein